MTGLADSAAVYVARSELARARVRPPDGMDLQDRAMFYASMVDGLMSALAELLHEIDAGDAS